MTVSVSTVTPIRITCFHRFILKQEIGVYLEKLGLFQEISDPIILTENSKSNELYILKTNLKIFFNSDDQLPYVENIVENLMEQFHLEFVMYNPFRGIKTRTNKDHLLFPTDRVILKMNL